VTKGERKRERETAGQRQIAKKTEREIELMELREE
jgi:hypothetical protein